MIQGDKRGRLSHPKTLQYTLDAVGQRTLLVDANAGRVTYSYDPAGRIANLLNAESRRTTFTHDGAARRTLLQLGNGAKTSWTYDAAGQITQLFHLKSDGSVISSFDYAYDAAGNPTRRVEADGTRTTWTYDVVNQLKRDLRGGANAYDQNYNYDGVGNRTLSGGATVYNSTYDAADQLTFKDNLTTGARVATYTYDAAGNGLTLQEQDGGPVTLTTMVWDDENRMTRWEQGATTHALKYTGDGKRSELVRTPGIDSWYVWDGENIQNETNTAGATRDVFCYEPAGYGKLLSIVAGSNERFYLFNAQGSTDRLLAVNQSAVDQYLYEAFGREVLKTGTTRNPFRWLGQIGYYTETETAGGVPIYVRARQYDPVSGRWWSVDPVEFMQIPQSFSYAAQNPVRFTDPSGESVMQGIQCGVTICKTLSKCASAITTLPVCATLCGTVGLTGGASVVACIACLFINAGLCGQCGLNAADMINECFYNGTKVPPTVDDKVLEYICEFLRDQGVIAPDSDCSGGKPQSCK